MLCHESARVSLEKETAIYFHRWGQIKFGDSHNSMPRYQHPVLPKHVQDDQFYTCCVQVTDKAGHHASV